MAIKSLPNGGHEVDIGLFLTAIPHPHNHCVPILDTFPDPVDLQRTLMVMPYLRPFNDPEFLYLVEAIDFMDQMLQVSCRFVTFTLAHSKVVLGTRIYA